MANRECQQPCLPCTTQSWSMTDSSRTNQQEAVRPASRRTDSSVRWAQRANRICATAIADGQYGVVEGAKQSRHLLLLLFSSECSTASELASISDPFLWKTLSSFNPLSMDDDCSCINDHYKRSQVTYN